jgi:hypothetical protein
MASETTVTTTTTEVIEVPAETKTIIINPPSDGTIVPEVTTNGDATVAAEATATTTTDAAAVVEKPEEIVKVVDPRENPVEWVKSIVTPAVHKANHHVLAWMQNQISPTEEEKQPLPGKDGAVKKSEFLNFLKDGTMLAKFANALAPGSIETVYDGEEAKVKENQVTNIQNFINFAKETAGFSETEVFTVDDLQGKGKSGYNAVFNTLFQLGVKAQEKFNATGLDVDSVVEAAKSAIKEHSLKQRILNLFQFFRLKKSKAVTSDEKTATTPVTNGNGFVATEETNNVVPVIATSNGDTKVADEIPPPVPTSLAPAVASQ